LLLVIELLAGFVLILGTSLLDATSFGYAAVWPVFLSGMAGLATALLLLRFAPKHPWDRVLLLAAAVLVAGVPSYLSAEDVEPGLVDGLLLALAFWRGVVVTYEPPGHEDVYARFGSGFTLFFLGIVFIVARGEIGSAAIWQPVAVAGIAYVGLAMLALGIARLEEEREPGALVAVALAIAAQIFLLLVLGLGALQIFSIDMFGWLGHHMQPFSDTLGATMFHVFTPLGGFIDSLLNHIKLHASKPHGTLAPHRTNATQNVAPLKHRPKEHPNYAAYGYAALIVFVTIIGVVGIAIWRSAPHRFRARRGDRPYEERREAALSLHDAWRAFLLFLRGLFRRGAAGTEASLEAIRRRVWGAPYPNDPVRRAYAKLLRRSAAAGMTRPVSVTPQEFAPYLAGRWAEGADEVEILTDAYTLHRYAGASLPAEHVGRVEAAWQRLRRVIRIPRRSDEK
jgi:hypothetical protein